MPTNKTESDRAWAQRMVRLYERHAYQGSRPSRVWIDVSSGARIEVPASARKSAKAMIDYLTAARARLRAEDEFEAKRIRAAAKRGPVEGYHGDNHFKLTRSKAARFTADDVAALRTRSRRVR